MSDPVADLSAAVADTASALRGNGPIGETSVERPKKTEFGDYSTNAALLLAPSLGQPPRDVAALLGDSLGERLSDAVERVEVAGPGFLNLFLSDAWFAAAVGEILAAGDVYGAGDPERGERINVEFVSANPTGPVTVAAGRHAAYGDSLCRILSLAGNEVDREYYVNDYGTQIERFAASIRARAEGEDPPEDGYQGAYVSEIADAIEGAAEMGADELGRRGVEITLQGVRETLERFRVHMHRFSHERALYDSGAVAAILDRLEEREHVYPLDGAVWLRTTTFGDDKDRVLMRSSGEMTYFTPDIANHEDKRRRGYDRVIDVWGADHHGYVRRMQAAWQALGADPERLELLIMQMVNLMEGGLRAQMSKRQGSFVTLDDLVEDVGIDATRWFLLQRSHETTLDLDLDLARKQSQDNPVYYAQYAHARIASILRKAGPERVQKALAADVAASAEVWQPSERALVKRLLEFPEEVREAADRRAPHRMTTYVTETAQSFSGFYRDCKVVGAAEEGGDEDLRIAMCEATRRVIAHGLDLLGVKAPDEM
ncbi:MAG: arginine--tRNA ligase [Actinomycetota bacterium]|nr:arginine--tRNA ligase [Actinomycetota bacterium]